MPVRELKDTSSRDAFFDVARGLRPDCETVYLFGINNAVDTSFETIFDNGGVYPFPVTAQALGLVSDDAGDTMSVLIKGLDGDYNQISETVALNGQTQVSTSQAFLRVNEAQITSGENAGDITVSSGSDVVALIKAGDGAHQAIVYSVAAGHSLFIKKVLLDGNMSADKAFRFRAAIHDLDDNDLILRFFESVTSTSLDFNLDIPFVVPEKKDFCIEAKAEQTAGVIAAYVSGVLIKEP